MKVNPAEGLSSFLYPYSYSGLGDRTLSAARITDYTAQIVRRGQFDSLRCVMLITFWSKRASRGKYIEATPLGHPIVYRDVFDRRDFPAIWEGR